MKTLLLSSLLVLSLQLIKAETAESQGGSTAPDSDKNDLARFRQKIEELEKRYKQEIDEMKQSSQREIEEMRSFVKNSTQPRNAAAGGAVYTRWGRTVCPPDATQVYRGYMTGGHYAGGTYGGHTSSYVCLAYPPQWATYSDTNEGNAELYAVQYACVEPQCPFSLENNAGETIHMDPAPCAVCQTPAYRPAQLMIAAMRECPAGWNIEYNGYLVSSCSVCAVDQTNVETVCLDDAPEVIPNSLTDHIGGTVYALEVNCGGLPCSTYPNYREITCVVCSN